MSYSSSSSSHSEEQNSIIVENKNEYEEKVNVSDAGFHCQEDFYDFYDEYQNNENEYGDYCEEEYDQHSIDDEEQEECEFAEEENISSSTTNKGSLKNRKKKYSSTCKLYCLLDDGHLEEETPESHGVICINSYSSNHVVEGGDNNNKEEKEKNKNYNLCEEIENQNLKETNEQMKDGLKVLCIPDKISNVESLRIDLMKNNCPTNLAHDIIYNIKVRDNIIMHLTDNMKIAIEECETLEKENHQLKISLQNAMSETKWQIAFKEYETKSQEFVAILKDLQLMLSSNVQLNEEEKKKKESLNLKLTTAHGSYIKTAVALQVLANQTTFALIHQSRNSKRNSRSFDENTNKTNKNLGDTNLTENLRKDVNNETAVFVDQLYQLNKQTVSYNKRRMRRYNNLPNRQIREVVGRRGQRGGDKMTKNCVSYGGSRGGMDINNNVIYNKNKGNSKFNRNGVKLPPVPPFNRSSNFNHTQHFYNNFNNSFQNSCLTSTLPSASTNINLTDCSSIAYPLMPNTCCEGKGILNTYFSSPHSYFHSPSYTFNHTEREEKAMIPIYMQNNAKRKVKGLVKETSSSASGALGEENRFIERIHNNVGTLYDDGEHRNAVRRQRSVSVLYPNNHLKYVNCKFQNQQGQDIYNIIHGQERERRTNIINNACGNSYIGGGESEERMVRHINENLNNNNNFHYSMKRRNSEYS